MKQRILVAGGDRRQTLLARRLEGLGEVETLAVPDCPDTMGTEPADLLILPCPSFDAAGRLRAGERLSLEELANRLRPGARVFGGGLGPHRSRMPAALREAEDLLEDPRYAMINGRLTAEAALALTLLRTGRGLSGRRCLVLGWGRIGKPLSLLLRSLGADVTVAARRPEVLAEAESFGLSAIAFSDLTGPRDLIYNTVPAPVLRPAQLAGLGEDCLWIELASAPGGLPEPLPDGLRVCPAGGLPGKYLPVSAADLLYETILARREVNAI